jgi:hypothetical protein
MGTTNTELKAQLETLAVGVENIRSYLFGAPTQQTPGIAGHIAEINNHLQQLNGLVARNCELIERGRLRSEELADVQARHAVEYAEMRGGAAVRDTRNSEYRQVSRAQMASVTSRLWELAKVVLPLGAIVALLAEKYL